MAGLRRGGRAPATRGIPHGYADVDPRTARRVRLSQELGPDNPVYPGDPAFTVRSWTTIAQAGYAVEHVTSLGTHTGTHVSAPAHLLDGGRYLSELDERWTLLPLVVLDVRRRVAAAGGDFALDPLYLRSWERRHGPIPRRSCVLLLTGFADRYRRQVRPGPDDDYYDPAPGFTGEAVAWLFDARGIAALGSDTFGPDATSDAALSASRAALTRGGITVENVGPGLARMREYGDWVAINGPRPRFSGFPVGITGFTVPL